MAVGGARVGAGRKPGVPNKATAEIKALAQQHGPAAIMKLAVLGGLVEDPETGVRTPATSEQAQVAAIRDLLDRAYGKAAQPQTGEGGEGPVLSEVVYRWAMESQAETEPDEPEPE